MGCYLPGEAATPSGEWRLHKAELPETRDFPAIMAFKVIAKCAARTDQAGVSVFLAFDRARFASSRALGNHVRGQGAQQFIP